MDYYQQIFKRKSFHIFKDIELINEEELSQIKEFIKCVKPLNPNIKTEIKIVKEEDTSCSRGGQYCILFYSEAKEEYLRNVGYIGEQIDLYLASKNIGALWFGIGKVEEEKCDGLDFVIMMNIGKVSEDKFRKDMFKAKRKALEEIWIGTELEFSNIVRYSPSACNSQPWIIENEGKSILVYRYKKEGKRGIMPKGKVTYYNKIDMGIFLFILEICLEHYNYCFTRNLYKDDFEVDNEKSLIAKYDYSKK